MSRTLKASLHDAVVVEKIVCEQRADEGLRFFKDGCIGTIRTIDSGGDKRVIEIEQIGSLTPNPKRINPQTYRVYNKEGLSPTLGCMQGGNLQPMIVASRGRDPDNTSDRAKGNSTEQRLGPKVINPLKGRTQYGWHFEQEVYSEESLLRALKAGGGSGNITKVIKPTAETKQLSVDVHKTDPQYRIRKLTPKECWRLMGFTDEDFHKAEKVNSNSQLYKQAGNSIVVDVLEAIFRQMM